MQITLQIKCPTCISDNIKKNGKKWMVNKITNAKIVNANLLAIIRLAIKVATQVSLQRYYT